MRNVLVILTLLFFSLDLRAAISIGQVMYAGGTSHQYEGTQASDTITLTAGASVGQWVIINFVNEANYSVQPKPIASIADSKSHTGTFCGENHTSSVHNGEQWRYRVTTALSAGDTITITYQTSTQNTTRNVVIYNVSGASATQPDVTVVSAVTSFGFSVPTSITTSTAGAMVCGMVVHQGDNTYTIGTGTTVGGEVLALGGSVGLKIQPFYRIVSPAGPYNQNGTLANQEGVIVIETALTPATTSTYYVDFSAGVDSQAGTATGTAWKHCPGDTNATSTASSTTLAAGDTVIFKGGSTYTGDIAIKQSGSSGLPIAYDGTGATWGSGRSLMDCNNTYYHAFSCTSSAKNYITIKGFKITKAKNANSRQNQTINRAGSDITGVNYGGDGDIYSQGAVQANNVSFWYLDDLWIYESENCYDRAVLNAEGDGNSLTDLNCPIEKAGISFVGTASDNTVTNCVIWATGHECIKLAGSARLLITDCDLGGTIAAGATSTNMGWFAVGVLMASGSSGQPLAVATVRRTLVHDGWQYQGDESQQRSHSGDWFHLFGSADGILQASDDVHDILFDRVYCYNNHRFANNNGTSTYFIESDVYNVEWRNCLLINGFSGGIEMRDCSNMVVNATTFISDNDQPFLLKAGSGSGFGPKAIYLTNNVFLTKSGNSANVAMGTSGGAYDGEAPHEDYNIFFTSAHGNFIELHGTNYTTRANWTAKTGQGVHSLFIDPKLVSIPTGSGWDTASSGDYHPSAANSSPLISAGLDQSSTFTIFYDGTSRSAPWTIGALMASSSGTVLKHFPSTIRLYGVQIR